MALVPWDLMSTTDLARFSTSPKAPGWTHDELVAQLRQMGLADYYIVGQAEAGSQASGSLDQIVTMACLGDSLIVLSLGLGVAMSVVEKALNEIWADVCRSRNPRALVQAAREATLRRIGDLGATPSDLEMLRQFL